MEFGIISMIYNRPFQKFLWLKNFCGKRWERGMKLPKIPEFPKIFIFDMIYFFENFDYENYTDFDCASYTKSKNK